MSGPGFVVLGLVGPSASGEPGGTRWLVQEGEVSLFLARQQAGGGLGRRRPVTTLVAPAALVLDEAPEGWSLVTVPGLDCSTQVLDDTVNDEVVRRCVQNTVAQLGAVLEHTAIPPNEKVIRLGRRPAYVAVGRAAVLEECAWVAATEGEPTLAGHALPRSGAPVPPRVAIAGGRFHALTARPLDEIGTDDLCVGLAWLLDVTVAVRLAETLALDAAEHANVGDWAESARHAERTAVRVLVSEFEPADAAMVVSVAGVEPIVAAAMRVGAHAGFKVRAPRGGLGGREGTDAVRAVAAASRLFFRRVALDGDWWVGPDEAVLGFRPNGSPVALLPAAGGMIAVDEDGGQQSVNAQVAVGLLHVGFVFSRPIEGEDLNAWAIAAPALAKRRSALVRYAGWALVTALIGLAVPFATGVVFGEIIPKADRSRLLFLIAVLVALSLANVPLQVVLTAARTRVEAPTMLDIQRGVWGRVLRSPVAFVRSMGAGDLSVRLMSLEGARGPIEQTLLAPLPTMLSGLAAGAVLFHYSGELATVAVMTALAMLAVAVWLARAAANSQLAVETASGQVNGFLFQVYGAIPKLRVAAAESRALLAWAGRFRGAVGQRLRRAVGHQLLFTGMIPMLGTLSLLAAIAITGPTSVTVGTFIAFQTTYSLFLAGVSTFATSTGTVLQLRPTIHRAVGLTAAIAEAGEGRTDPGNLRGGVELSNVTFRYQPELPVVLDDLSLRIAPSEMIALAGASGCGKSTIVRLLLGFEQPERGTVLFDGFDLTSLDVESVRRQMGVVLQDGQLMPGSVHQNIAGVADLSEREAWEIAEIVGLADEIRAMPMQMQTVVTLNGGAFSGGQRQRLLIARALAPRPRILILDEATSALDNVTQQVITRNLAELGMTRIVVAHRLSTMVDADRIVMVVGGRIAEQGRYEDLMARRGAFWSLAARQVI